jgi:hypothetical protein
MKAFFIFGLYDQGLAPIGNFLTSLLIAVWHSIFLESDNSRSSDRETPSFITVFTKVHHVTYPELL